MTFNTNEDFRSQFNADWATKLIVGVDEVLLNRREDSERIKNLSTAFNYKAEAKGKDRDEISFFAKFVLCSNNENNPVIIDQGETRFWVIKVPPLEKDRTDMLVAMKKEIPHFLWFLSHRELSTREESRMWFRADKLVTPALLKIVNYNRGKVENEILSVIAEVMNLIGTDSYEFCVNDIADMLELRGMRTEHSHVRRILTDNWKLKASETRRYHSRKFTACGDISDLSKTGRTFTVSKQQIENMLDDCDR